MNTKYKYGIIDHDSPVPLHSQAEQMLRKMIQQNQYKKKGAMLPNEVDLSRSWGMSRATLRLAINKLVMEGLLERKKGVGTKVKEKKFVTHLDNWISFTQEMNQQHTPLNNLYIDVQRVKADERTADALNIEKGREVLLLKRLRGTDKNTPFVYFESYFHPRIGLPETEDFSKPLYELLENYYHIIPAISKEEIRAEKADKQIAKTLKINMGEPILERIRTVLDIGHKPIEYCLCFYRGDLFTYFIDIKRNL